MTDNKVCEAATVSETVVEDPYIFGQIKRGSIYEILIGAATYWVCWAATYRVFERGGNLYVLGV